MQDGRIKESQLKASSSFDIKLGPTYGRLHSTVEFQCWASKTLARGEYIQIDLLQLHIISKIATQGRGQGNRQEWVTKYSLMYSLDETKWETYLYGGFEKVRLMMMMMTITERHDKNDGVDCECQMSPRVGKIFCFEHHRSETFV